MAVVDSTAHASPQGLTGHVAGQAIVRFKPSVALEQENEVLGGLVSTRRARIPHIDVQLVDLPFGADEAGYVELLRGRPEVEFAELNRLVPQASVTPNDPGFVDQAASLGQIRVPQAWSTATGSGSVTIAIVDCGVDGSHPDLAPNMVAGWNFADNNANTMDITGHGTLSAGVAAAAGNNGMGIAGVSWASKIMPIRVGSVLGEGNLFDIANGLVWASDHGARVANVGFNLGDTLNSAVSSAAQYFQGRGGVVVTAAGNNGQLVSYPSDPNFLTVSGITASNVIAANSNRGTNVDLAAPWQLFGTGSGGIYIMWTGTSYSSAAVAGVAALALSANSALTGAQLRDILTQSADDIGPAGWDTSYGWGRVNAERALALAGGGGGGPPGADTQPPSSLVTAPLDQATVSGRLTVRATASDNVGVTRVEFFIDGVLKGTDSSAPYTYAWNTKQVSHGAHAIVSRAYDAAGNFGNSPTVTVYR